jgi:PST family polysaccharide transporter
LAQKKNNFILKTILIENILSLTVLQAINFGLSLIVLPYLTMTLGSTAFGEVVFAQLIINYAVWIVNWGFYLGATNRISANRLNKEKIEKIFTASWSAQFLLTVIVVIIYILTIFIVPRFNGLEAIYLAGVTIILANTLLPIWLLNGLEKIKLGVILQIGSKLLALPIIFILVHNPDTSWIYILATGLGTIIMSLVALWVIFFQLRITFCRPNISEIKFTLKEDFSLFVSSITANLNNTLVPAALGVFNSPEALGFYNIADRIRGATLMILSPIHHALFPRLCYLFSNNRNSALKLVLKSALFIITITTFLLTLLLMFGPSIIYFFGGEGFEASVEILNWLALSTLFTTISSIAIHHVIIPNNHYAIFLKVIIIALVINSILVFPITHKYGASGGAVLALLIEGLVALLLFWYVRRYRVLRSPKTEN